jgi:hypothetical protein
MGELCKYHGALWVLKDFARHSLRCPDRVMLLILLTELCSRSVVKCNGHTNKQAESCVWDLQQVAGTDITGSRQS